MLFYIENILTELIPMLGQYDNNTADLYFYE